MMREEETYPRDRISLFRILPFTFFPHWSPDSM
jgi:hypothetical protein